MNNNRYYNNRSNWNNSYNNCMNTGFNSGFTSTHHSNNNYKNNIYHNNSKRYYYNRNTPVINNGYKSNTYSNSNTKDNEWRSSNEQRGSNNNNIAYDNTGWEKSGNQLGIDPGYTRTLSCTLYVGLFQTDADVQKILETEFRKYGNIVYIRPYPEYGPYTHAFIQYQNRVDAGKAKYEFAVGNIPFRFISRVKWGISPKNTVYFNHITGVGIIKNEIERNNSDVGYDKEPRFYVCQICNNKGHFMNDCPYKEPNNIYDDRNKANSTNDNSDYYENDDNKKSNDAEFYDGINNAGSDHLSTESCLYVTASDASESNNELSDPVYIENFDDDKEMDDSDLKENVQRNTEPYLQGLCDEWKTQNNKDKQLNGIDCDSDDDSLYNEYYYEPKKPIKLHLNNNKQNINYTDMDKYEYQYIHKKTRKYIKSLGYIELRDWICKHAKVSTEERLLRRLRKYCIDGSKAITMTSDYDWKKLKIKTKQGISNIMSIILKCNKKQKVPKKKIRYKYIKFGLNNISIDILGEIMLNYLVGPDIFTLTSVCKELNITINNVASDDFIWDRLIKRDFPKFPWKRNKYKMCVENTQKIPQFFYLNDDHQYWFNKLESQDNTYWHHIFAQNKNYKKCYHKLSKWRYKYEYFRLFWNKNELLYERREALLPNDDQIINIVNYICNLKILNAYKNGYGIPYIFYINPNISNDNIVNLTFMVPYHRRNITTINEWIIKHGNCSFYVPNKEIPTKMNLPNIKLPTIIKKVGEIKLNACMYNTFNSKLMHAYDGQYYLGYKFFVDGWKLDDTLSRNAKIIHVRNILREMVHNIFFKQRSIIRIVCYSKYILK